jgi:hypothetical protein
VRGSGDKVDATLQLIRNKFACARLACDQSVGNPPRDSNVNAILEPYSPEV